MPKRPRQCAAVLSVNNPQMPGSIIDSARHGLSHFNRFSRNLVAPPLSPVIPMEFMIFVVVDDLDRLPADLTPTSEHSMYVGVDQAFPHCES